MLPRSSNWVRLRCGGSTDRHLSFVRGAAASQCLVHISGLGWLMRRMKLSAIRSGEAGAENSRRVEPEWLDGLPATDPGAIRSRRDLRRLNRIMGHVGIVAS